MERKSKKIITKRADGSVRVAIEPIGESIVQQQFKEETNINRIMEKYHKGVAITHLSKKQGVYGDFSNIKDYSDSLSSVIRAQNAFMGLPSAIRKRFNNDPQGLIDFVSDSKNYEEAVQLGLIAKPAPANTQPTINDDAKIAKPE